MKSRRYGRWVAAMALAWGCSSDPAAVSDAGAGDGGADVADVADAAKADVDAGPPREACNPLAYEWDCLLPFPWDGWRVADPAAQGGARVVISEPALPHTEAGGVYDPAVLHGFDGFSPGTQIAVKLPSPVQAAQLHPYDPADSTPAWEGSLAAASATVIVDAMTGQRVPHVAEMDARPDDPSRSALVLRPMVRLQNGHRYVVALRGLRDASGDAFSPPSGFAAIRDRGSSPDARVAPLAARYEAEVFPALAAAGVPRAELTLAWDFTVRAAEPVAADMLAVRDAVIARVRARRPAVTVTMVTENPSAHIARQVEGTVRVPLYLTGTSTSSSLRRDAQGRPTSTEEVEVPFTAIIPPSVQRRPAGAPARLLQFGHGFFGGRDEITGGFVSSLADQEGFVVVGVDWWGMSRADVAGVISALILDLSRVLAFTDRVHQAMANQIALAAARGALAEDDAFRVDGHPVFDPSTVYFYGLSQGHILGGTYVALSPDIDRAVLGVGGASFSLMMSRARPFLAFLAVVAMGMPDPLDQLKFTLLTQTGFDRVDPITWAPRVISDPLPGAPASRRVLQHMGMGDTAVPNIASELHARAMGVPLLTPASARPVPGLSPVTSPAPGSAFVAFDLGVRPLPTATSAIPTEDSPVHEGQRRLGASMRQIGRFLNPDAGVESTCEGPCDPE